ncbi:MarR family transcriptional regulator, partial [Bacillus amyloliquefaciens]
KELLEALEEEGLSPETEAKINELLAETKQWIDYCEWLDNLIAFLESEEIFKHVPKPS